MRREIVILTVSFLTILTFFRPRILAQQAVDMGGTPTAQRIDRLEARVKQLNEALNLTDEQKAKITPLLADEIKQIQQVRADSNLSRRERFAKIRKIRQDANQQIRPILTPEQQKKLDDMRQEAREQFKGRGGRGGRNRPMP